MIAKEKIKDKYKLLEDETYKKFTGEELVEKLNSLRHLQE